MLIVTVTAIASLLTVYHILCNFQIMGYLSGSSPQIISGAVSALSVLVYKDPGICFSMPDVVSSLLSMLQSKALEVIKVSFYLILILLIFWVII